jgi:hypothetical protein
MRAFYPVCQVAELAATSRYTTQHALKLASAQGFDRIDHQALLATVPAPPRLRRPRKAWLKAGILEDDHLAPTTAGTPQGGSDSPLLALIALHGMDKAIPRVYPRARGIASAEDGGGSTKSARDLSTVKSCSRRGWPRWASACMKPQVALLIPSKALSPGLSFWDVLAGSIGAAHPKRAKAREAMGVEGAKP